MRNVLVVGAWRNGLSDGLASVVEEVLRRRDAGFRQLPYESSVTEMADLLTGYDELAADLLLNEQIPEPPSPPRQGSPGRGSPVRVAAV